MLETRIDPIKASEHIRETYLRYLTTTFGLKNSEISRQFREISRKSEGLFKGPILEVTPNYRRGKSILELITENEPFLSENFGDGNYAPGLEKEAQETILSLERPLYTHQEEALRKVIGENHNIVVATGTGSGKTECFLLPIIDYLLKEREAGRLGPGVRALLVYPMNALANDQVARLRNLLPPETGITFGRYTGQVLQGYYKGLDTFKKENNGIPPQANELFCRDQILGIEPSAKEWPHKNGPVFLGPPHILLTNFAMLEYLLMRPQDSTLFDGQSGKTWRFIVLDEAHVYSGALGTEIGYLIRRLKDRVCGSQKGRLVCIATSATVGVKDQDDRETVVESFRNLFGEMFEVGDLILGDVVSSNETLGSFDEWDRGASEFYEYLERISESEYASVPFFLKAVHQLAEECARESRVGWPARQNVIYAEKQIKHLKDVRDATQIFLFYLLAGDKRIRSLINRLEKAPINLTTDAWDAWDASGLKIDIELVQRNLIKVVNLASRARLSDQTAPLLAARYHFFVRSLEGISVRMLPSASLEGRGLKPQLILGRHGQIPNAAQGNAIAFELRACSRCGQSFLHGHFLEDGRFVSYYQRSRLEEKRKKSVYLSIDLEQLVESAEDEMPLSDEKPPSGTDDEDENLEVSSALTRTQLGDPQYICGRCGFVSDDNELSCDNCRNTYADISRNWIPVRRVFSESGSTIKACPACGARKTHGGSIIRSFSPGDDAASAVLAQALMVHVPATSETTVKREVASKPEGRFGRTKVESGPVSAGGKPRLLAFSDSRQDAAYFATYLDRTSNQILHRQLILRAIERLQKEFDEVEAFSPSDLVRPLIQEAQAVGMFELRTSEIEKTSEVSKWINAELMGLQRRHGLEGVGLITWDLKYREDLLSSIEPHDEGLKQDYGFSGNDFVLLLEIFLSDLRKRNVLQPMLKVDIRDAYFWPRNRPYSICPETVNASLSIASWIPQATRNIRSDFLERLLHLVGRAPDKKLIKEILNDLWELSIGFEGIWEEVPSVNALWGGRGRDGVVWRIRSDAWRGRLTTRNKGSHLFKCDTCGNLTRISLRDVCPSYRCPGKLTEIHPETEFAENHYRYLYGNDPVPLSVREHTAQITNQEGAERQRDFSNDLKPLNVLSCSTTFELGVDVGDLHTVFLRNVPPTVANYIQRSGRAGRRLSAAAFVLTYCRRRSHDLGYFDCAEKLISGKVLPTVIKTDNSRIARRHLHGVVLSHFWRVKHPELFEGPERKGRGYVKWFFFASPLSGTQMVHNWLHQQPKDLYDQIVRIFSHEMAEELGFNKWRWVEVLVSERANGDETSWNGSLGLAHTELQSEYKEYGQLQVNIPELFSYAKAQMKRIRSQQIMDFLASRNVLPKYGFPVDVVSLRVQSTDEWAQRIELDRDLKLALGEYAPGCTLVANGMVITSYALEKISGKAWPEYVFAICNSCGKFYRSETSLGKVEDTCECGQSLNTSGGTLFEGTFVEPIFGFRTQLGKDGQEPVEVRPERTFPTRVYFSHYEPSQPQVRDPFLPEGSPDERMGFSITKRYSRNGVLAVLNGGRANQGFWLCFLCGFGISVVSGKPRSHKTPWGKPCKGRSLRRIFLGHEFQSDVLELRFMGSESMEYGQGFWLSLTAAILAGSAQALDIERDDIDGTVLRFAGQGHRSIVLFDNVPGGAGHVRRVSDHLEKVMEVAFSISENCLGCSRDQSCNACLRTFRNQYAHDLLQRGPVADFLSKILSGLYRKGAQGFFSLGMTDVHRWFINQIRRSYRVDLILPEIPVSSSESYRELAWSDTLHYLAQKGCQLRLFLSKEIVHKVLTDPRMKIGLYSLALLVQNRNVEILTGPITGSFVAQLYIEFEGGAYAARWPKDANPLENGTNIEVSVLKDTLEKAKGAFDAIVLKNNDRVLTPQRIEDLLQGTKVIRVESGSKQTWKDLLEPYLPDNIHAITIHDRYIRNSYQFKSLEMLLDFFSEIPHENDVEVVINTTSEDEEMAINRFRFLQVHYNNKGIKVKYNLNKSSIKMPHYRKIQIKSQSGDCSLWLDKGIDIYRYENLRKPSFHTVDTYIVVEKKLQ